MTISAHKVSFDDATMWLALSDGRTLGVPLVWFPRLLNATPAQREGVEITPFGLHWPELDEDIAIPAPLVGKLATRAARAAPPL
ncbi:MAG: DUF2442 domain-containing protein [Rhodobacteraceae bacterium]|nr:MAG: DUF2442 domain-containing protein [Paracoccaceae bacterium]